VQTCQNIQYVECGQYTEEEEEEEIKHLWALNKIRDAFLRENII
jgi:hypothetical protein